MRNEVHVCNAENGHANSTDCWCEPVSMSWIVNKFGVKVFVVEHYDETLKHHVVVLAERQSSRTLDSTGSIRHPGAPWVTRLLDDVKMPPPDPNERKID